MKNRIYKFWVQIYIPTIHVPSIECCNPKDNNINGLLYVKTNARLEMLLK